MNEMLICENNILDHKYRYYLVERLYKKNDKMHESFRYGIKIEKYNVNDEFVDSECIVNIFESKEKTIKAIRILNKLQVTPITLKDIVIDNIYTR